MAVILRHLEWGGIGLEVPSRCLLGRKLYGFVVRCCTEGTTGELAEPKSGPGLCVDWGELAGVVAAPGGGSGVAGMRKKIPCRISTRIPVENCPELKTARKDRSDQFKARSSNSALSYRYGK